MPPGDGAIWRTQAGRGLSPFTTFRVAAEALRRINGSPFETADQVMLVFEFEKVPTGTPMEWIGSCRAG